MRDVIPLLVGGVGLISFVVTVIVSLANRGIKNERIDHLTGRVNDLEDALGHERTECQRDITALKTQLSHQQGQIDTLTGDLAKKLAEAILPAIIRGLEEARR